MHTTDRVRVAAQAMLSPRTVDRAYAGANIYATTRARIVQAAEALGLPPPPESTAPEQEAA